MNADRSLSSAVSLVVGVLLAISSLFIVDQTEQALVLQFGQPRAA